MFNRYFLLFVSTFSFKKVYIIGIFVLISCTLHEYIAKADQNSLKTITNSDQPKIELAKMQSSPILFAKNTEKSEIQQEGQKSTRRKTERRILTAKEEAANQVFRLEKRINELKILEPSLKAEVITVTKMASAAKTTKERRTATQKIRDAENKYISAVKELRILNKKVEIARLELKNAGADKEMIAKIKSMASESSGLAKKSIQVDRTQSKDSPTRRGITSKKAIKEPMDSSIAKTQGKKKMRFPWLKKKQVTEEEIDLEDPLAELERELTARSKGGVGPVATLKRQPTMRPLKSVNVLRIAYNKSLQEESEACFQLMDAYTSKKIPKFKELAADKEYTETRMSLKKVIKELERAERNASSPHKG